jgi:hypothetical protein
MQAASPSVQEVGTPGHHVTNDVESVVGRLLHDHVARLQMHIAVVEHHVDLAGENDRVVETAGAMHQRMLHRNTARRHISDAFLQHFGGILASVAVSSDRNSTTRNLVPLSGGAVPIGRPEGSSLKRSADKYR